MATLTQLFELAEQELEQAGGDRMGKVTHHHYCNFCRAIIGAGNASHSLQSKCQYEDDHFAGWCYLCGLASKVARATGTPMAEDGLAPFFQDGYGARFALGQRLERVKLVRVK